MRTTTTRSAAPIPPTTAERTSPTPGLDRIILESPDIVDRLFDYLLTTMPDLRARVTELAQAEHALRSEYRASRGLHIRAPDSDAERAELLERVLAYPKTVCASEVARQCGVSRATVYRWRHEQSAAMSHAAP